VIDRTRPAPPARHQLQAADLEGVDELWWDPHGPASLLHAMNGQRLRFFLAGIGSGGARVLDAGCGGGLVAKGLIDAGMSVVGLDLSVLALGVARRAAGDGFRPAAGRIERLPFADESFDAIVAPDVLEHIPDLPAAVADLARVLRPGGSLLFDTINRTAWAWVTALWGAERLLGLAPRGTHDWRLFIRPHELDRLLRAAGLARVALTGLRPRIGPRQMASGLLRRRIDTPRFTTGPGRHVSYLGHYRKDAP
jgi:2-polyprenyl-6-hydroxyphenyl methylase/3-demethylubiquinone-9 3-methyltransferase